MIVSIDIIHKPGSTTERRESTEELTDPLKSFEIAGGKLVEAQGFVVAEIEESNGAVSETGAIGNLSNLLYGLENLRKREGDEKDG